MENIDLRKTFNRQTKEVVRVSPIEGGIWFTDKYVKWLENQILDNNRVNVSVLLPDDVDISVEIENQINFIKKNWNVSKNYIDGYAKGFYYCVKFIRGNER